MVDVAAMRPMTLGVEAIALAQIGRPGAARLALADIEDSWQHEAKAQMLMALLALAEEFAQLGFTVSGAECAAAAARLLRRDGRAADADRANGLAVALTGLIDDFRTPGLGTVVVLTEREREVGELASKRRRNREIADHLGISIRTVDNHLASLYRELGINRRDELSTWFENAENGQAFTVASDSADSH